MKRFMSLMLPGLIGLAGCATAPYDYPGAPAKNTSTSTIAVGKPLPGSRYAMKKDAPPKADVDVSHIPEPQPRYEPLRAAGNKSPYTVWGKTYHVMSSPEGYVEEGVGSWYGRKFHGHKTSNGEIFDMYKITAAHKSLPIPSYARVTNLDNGRSITVRVNDRGPFHGDRIIDLSYAAAKKLGYQSKGTARLKVAAITVDKRGGVRIADSSSGSSALGQVSQNGQVVESYVQVGAFRDKEAAQRLKATLSARIALPVRVHRAGGWMSPVYRVQAGPLDSASEAESVRNRVFQAGFADAIVVSQ